MNNWRMKLYQFMNGRYGNDSFNQFLFIVALVLMLASNLVRVHILYTVGILLFFYGWFRFLSRNIGKRQQENQKFLNMKAKFLRKSSGNNFKPKQKKAWKKSAQSNTYTGQQQADAENYNYYRCRNCGQVVRVPKGKGSVRITCPGCKNTFIDRT